MKRRSIISISILAIAMIIAIIWSTTKDEEEQWVNAPWLINGDDRYFQVGELKNEYISSLENISEVYGKQEGADYYYEMLSEGESANVYKLHNYENVLVVLDNDKYWLMYLQQQGMEEVVADEKLCDMLCKDNAFQE